MKQGKKILSLLLMLTLLLSMGVCAFAEDDTEAVIVMEAISFPTPNAAVRSPSEK